MDEDEPSPAPTNLGPATETGAWIRSSFPSSFTPAEIEAVTSKFGTLDDLFSVTKGDFETYLPTLEGPRREKLWSYVGNAASEFDHPQGKKFLWPCQGYVPPLFVFCRRKYIPRGRVFRRCPVSSSVTGTRESSRAEFTGAVRNDRDDRTSPR